MSSKPNTGFRLLCAWICGYGVGLWTAGIKIEDPTTAILAIGIGLLLAVTGFVVDITFKRGGLVDKNVQRKVERHFNEQHRK